MRYKDFLHESIEDKGILKAIFFAGLPGSGKSTIATRITDGTVSPRFVNTDKSFEFLSKRANVLPTAAMWELFGKQSMTINAAMLYQYLNSMLPLFIDGTSANPSSTMRRIGLLDSIGYDAMMVWVDVDLETALHRAQQRKREVMPEFIKQVYNNAKKNKMFYQQRFGSNFVVVDNNATNFDAMENKTYSIANQFFTSPISNPIGQDLIKNMKENGYKYLVPNVYSSGYLKKVISVWYMS